MTWSPTHTVPPGGLATVVNNQPSTPLEAGLRVQVVEVAGGWARVVASNGWECWVEAAGLVPVFSAPQAVAAPPRASAAAPRRAQPAPFGTPGWFAQHRDVTAAVAVVVSLALLIGGSLLFTKSAQANQGEVVTQPASSVGSSPFTPSVAKPEATPAAAPKAPSSQQPTRVSGTVPGLYGGTQNDTTCDREQLIKFLQENPDKARAWASVEGISVQDIPDYIRGLTPVRLRYDTRVTNHGFANGYATAYQAVLQAGTAVLVDRYGVPRARCYCGNPLLPPVTYSNPYYTGDRWPGFTPTAIIIVVVPPQPVTTIIAADPSGRGLAQPVGGGSGGTPAQPVQPSPVPVSSPIPGTNPLNGNYEVTSNFSQGTVTGTGPNVTPADCNQVGDTTGRWDIVINGEAVTFVFSDASGVGTFKPADGSFSVPVTPPAGLDNEGVEGRLANNTIDGNIVMTKNYPAGKQGCSIPFSGKKVA
jgi:hypothetical protein